MAEKKERWFNNGWTVSIGSGIILLVLPPIWDTIAKQPYYTTFQKIWAGILWLLNFQIAVWWIIVFVLAVFIALYLFAKPNPKEDVVSLFQPHFINYKVDTLKKWKWSWDYKLNHFNQKYEISDLVPVCPNCDIKMLDYNSTYSGRYLCPKCDLNYSSNSMYGTWESTDAIQALIIDNINKNKHLSS